MYTPTLTPSLVPIYVKPLNTGSGKIIMNDGENNNNKLNRFMSIE
jgi:hypothetical protein